MRSLHRLNRSLHDADNLKSLEVWEHAHREYHMALLA
jgi:hypothetical protein